MLDEKDPRPRRLSTPGPASAPRWDAPGPDFDAMLQAIPTMESPGGYQQGPTASPLGLPDLGLGLAKKQDWVAAYAPAPEYVSPTYGEGKSLMPGSTYKGITGLPEHKGPSPYGLQKDFWGGLSAANAAMKAAGLGTFGITDGWRSYEQQVALKKKKPKLAATPGRSQHGLGLAADLKLTNAQYKWLKANGARYGLYNLPGETWHWSTTGH